MSWYQFRPYVPVARRRALARQALASREANGFVADPVGELSHRIKIATSFWGAAWCSHLESFSDYENRLPRGRTYVRNGSVVHLAIKRGKITTLVQGSDLYEQTIRIDPLAAAKWKIIQSLCQGKIGSLIELLQGRISDEIMTVVTDRNSGLFPEPGEIKLQCSCPDWAEMCKHVAAVLYGIGARLDTRPELLFELRGVDHNDLIAAGASADGLDRASKGGQGRRRALASTDLGNVFGIDFESEPEEKPRRTGGRPRVRRRTRYQKKKTAKASVARETPEPAKRRPFKATGAGVRSLRNRLGLSRSDFARKLGVSAQSITNWENSRGKLVLRSASLEGLKRLHRDA